MLCEEQRARQAGAEHADSYTFNPHKWLFTNFDCNVLWVADRAPLIASLSILPPYLRNPASESGEVIDYRDWHVPLGHRFRALKLWWVLRSYGAAGLRAHLREHMALAQELGRRVDAHPRLERVAPVSFALLCLRHVDGNDATDALARAINAHADLHVTPSEIAGMRFVRVAIGQTRTTAADVERLWNVIADAADLGV
jgi:aromatic-L-amino-acid/L-tryptophan decarboxylase